MGNRFRTFLGLGIWRSGSDLLGRRGLGVWLGGDGGGRTRMVGVGGVLSFLFGLLVLLGLEVMMVMIDLYLL